MPAATTFSHGLRSKCADLPELLPYSCRSPASIPVNIINFIRIYPRLRYTIKGFSTFSRLLPPWFASKQNHIRLLVRKRIYQLHTFWLQSVPCQGHDDFRQPEGPVHQEKFPPGFSSFAACAATSSKVHFTSCLAIAFGASGLVSPPSHHIRRIAVTTSKKQPETNPLPL